MPIQEDKNEPSRFLGDGVSFKAKLIGILEVSEARGDRMCQEALADLKMAIRAAGEHKQRITINIAIDGLRLRDEKTGDSLYHHPVHKISFIAQDMSDSRAFGYIFGSPDTGHRFFGIKTDKAASQVVIAMRDLFQVVFELKKKEIELAKQHIEQKNRFGTTTSSSLFADTTLSTTKSGQSECSNTQETSSSRTEAAKEPSPKSYQNGDSHSSTKITSSVEPTSAKLQSTSEGAHGGNSEAIADLVDLELELSSIQQGIHQMERITPSDPFGPSKEDPFNSDPFGDSFISFPQKPFLPPPPSARDRQSRTASDTSNSLFSPKTPKTGDSTTVEANLFKVSQDDTASCDWFTPTGSDTLFEDTAPTSFEEKQKEDKTPQESNASILSQFDVFTELDPLGTGRSKPYVDKKLFFQELKNPPKKVLKDLVSTQPSDSTLFPANFDTTETTTAGNTLVFPTDPFVESDPFDKTDPFAEADFNKSHDPFDTDFIEDFKVFNKQEQKVQNKAELTDTLKKVKYSTPQPEKLQPLFPSPLSKSPNRSGIFEKQASLQTNHVSPRSLSSLSKQSTFDVKFEDKKYGKMSQLHENPSLDMSSESECAPEPPPRPTTNISPIKPPPLPPKKQPGDLTKPPPRPPHTEESHYDYMESYETGPNSLDSLETKPPLPVPARKSRFEPYDFTLPPQRPKKHIQGTSDEDYLTPVPPPLLPPQKKDTFRSSGYKRTGTDGILLPPPMRKDPSKRIDRHTSSQNTVVSLLDSKPKLSTSPTADKLNLTPDTLDITLSQLTLSGLNELASKLKIPPSQLSNMTLVQLTSYLSNYVKETSPSMSGEADATIPTFQADFSANFNDFTSETSAKTEPYDRYAVFRELLQQEEINKPADAPSLFKEETETEITEEIKTEEDLEIPEIVEIEIKPENTDFKPSFQESAESTDRYAALREIIIDDKEPEQKESNLEVIEEKPKTEEEIEKEQNDLNVVSFKNELEVKDKINEVENNIIEYESQQNQEIKEKLNIESPSKSPVTIKTESTIIKSPVPITVTEIIQTNNHLTSGSLSDAVTGSSPEMDNLANSEAVEKKNAENTTAESWAIFDTCNLRQETKEKQVQSEEGVSPWSSDSKEFGNGSPLDWQQRRDSESEGDWGRKRRDRDGTWWDTQGEVEEPYEKQKHRSTYIRDRRSTDSFEEDWYEAEEEQRPRRKTRQTTHSWGRTGGQSSSSRDVSPWEEEEPRGRRDDMWPSRRSRGPSWDRLHRRDSWDEDDDYEYEEEYIGKFHLHERHGSRDSDRGSRDSDRHSTPRGEPPDDWERAAEQWSEQDRRHARRKVPHEERWCRSDWDREEKPGKDKPGRYSSRYATVAEGKWRGERERKRDQDRYYKRDHSQESPWEDEYSNDPDEPPQSPRYLTARRNWKRPSSASEMDRKSGEIKSRQPYYISAGGSDGERDRRYKSNRRSRSRDSQFSEMSHNRHKPDPGLTLRYPHRNRDKMYSQKFENNFTQEVLSKAKLDVKLDQSNNKKSIMAGRKKGKELPSPKTESEPPKTNRKQHLMFENDFVNSETESPAAVKAKFNFENDFETSEAESPTVARHSKYTRAHTMFESDHSVKKNIRPNIKQAVGFESEFSKEPRRQTRSDFQEKDPAIKGATSPKPYKSIKQKSMFEDDFSPTDKSDSQCNDDNGISVIPEEPSTGEQRVSFTENNFDRISGSELRKKHILAKSRITNNIRPDLKKSDSVNIFARENDPFDDDFFSGKDLGEVQKVDSKPCANIVMEYKWTEDFDSFEIPEETNK